MKAQELCDISKTVDPVEYSLGDIFRQLKIAAECGETKISVPHYMLDEKQENKLKELGYKIETVIETEPGSIIRKEKYRKEPFLFFWERMVYDGYENISTNTSYTYKEIKFCCEESK